MREYTQEMLALVFKHQVLSLYTNIPHAEGIEACRELLNARTIQEAPTEDLIKLIIFNSTEEQFLLQQ